MYLGNGGINTLHSYRILLSDSIKERKRKIPGKHRRFFEALLPYYETDNYIFVHAGLRPGLRLEKQTISDLLWIRYDFIEAEEDFR